MLGWSKLVGWFKKKFWGKGKTSQNVESQNEDPYSSIDFNTAEQEVKRLRNKELSKEEAERALANIEAVSEFEKALKEQERARREAQADGVDDNNLNNGSNQQSIIETPASFMRKLADEWIASGSWFRITAFVTENVYAIKYDVQKASLFVQYKHWDPSMPVYMGSNASHGPGPIYEYTDVSIKEARDAFTSPDIGIWIWDNIRVRGTWSGHTKPMRLVSISHGYLPRKAVMNYQGREGEWFVPRTRWIKKSNTKITSQLPLAPAFRFIDLQRILMSNKPARGTPFRAKPNDGRPYNGRP